jgi:hypothetical protein
MRRRKGWAQLYRSPVKLSRSAPRFIVFRFLARRFGLLENQLGFVRRADESNFDVAALCRKKCQRFFPETARTHAQRVASSRDLLNFQQALRVRHAAPDFIEPDDRVRFRADVERPV